MLARLTPSTATGPPRGRRGCARGSGRRSNSDRAAKTCTKRRPPVVVVSTLSCRLRSRHRDRPGHSPCRPGGAESARGGRAAGRQACRRVTDEEHERAPAAPRAPVCTVGEHAAAAGGRERIELQRRVLPGGRDSRVADELAHRSSVSERSDARLLETFILSTRVLDASGTPRAGLTGYPRARDQTGSSGLDPVPIDTSGRFFV
jgi:hypothetical protein